MVYKVSEDRKNFKIEQRVATSVLLIAEGGVKEKEVIVQKVID